MMDRLSSKSSELYIFWVHFDQYKAKLQSTLQLIPIKNQRNYTSKIVGCHPETINPATTQSTGRLRLIH